MVQTTHGSESRALHAEPEDRPCVPHAEVFLLHGRGDFGEAGLCQSRTFFARIPKADGIGAGVFPEELS